MAHNRSFFREMIDFMVKKKKWWLMPIIITLLLVGVLIIFAQSSAISPFIYAFF